MIQKFFPSVKNMTFRGYKVLNKTAGPFNATFYKLSIKFTNYKPKIIRLNTYITGIVVLQNYTYQMMWINSGFRPPSWKKFVPMNMSDPEAENAVNFTVYRVLRNRWFTPQATFIKPVNVSKYIIAKNATYAYYKVDLLFDVFSKNVTVGAVIFKNPSYTSYSFNSIGMRWRKPKRIPKIIRRVRSFPKLVYSEPESVIVAE